MERIILWMIFRASLKPLTKKQFPGTEERVWQRGLRRKFRAQYERWWIQRKVGEASV